MIEVGIAAVKAFAVLMLVLHMRAILLCVERKGSALIQDRIAANRANIFGVMPFNFGLINTLIADPIKLITKEDVVPAGADTISFSVTGTINVGSQLPSLSDQAGVTIDGSVGGVPKIEISGGGGVTDGLQVLSSNNIIRGLIINGFTGAGIAISASVRSATNNLIEQ